MNADATGIIDNLDGTWTITLDGTISDDGLPNPPATVTQTWTENTKPAGAVVTITNASSEDTTAIVDTAGDYTFTLTANDSALTGTDTTTITASVSSQPSSTLEQVLTDHLGSTSVLVNSNSGTTTHRARQYPYGTPRTSSGVSRIDQTFTGQTDDPGTGLIDYNARQYDPVLGRFLQADSVSPVPTSGRLGLNRYGYVGSSPLTLVDPSGNSPCRFLTSPEAQSACRGIASTASAASEGIQAATTSGTITSLSQAKQVLAKAEAIIGDHGPRPSVRSIRSLDDARRLASWAWNWGPTQTRAGELQAEASGLLREAKRLSRTGRAAGFLGGLLGVADVGTSMFDAWVPSDGDVSVTLEAGADSGFTLSGGLAGGATGARACASGGPKGSFLCGFVGALVGSGAADTAYGLAEQLVTDANEAISRAQRSADHSDNFLPSDISGLSGGGNAHWLARFFG